MTTPLLITINMETNTKTILLGIFCICYLIYFQGNKVKKVQDVLDINFKANAIISAYALKLDLIIQNTSIRTPKIDNSPLETYKMASTLFLI